MARTRAWVLGGAAVAVAAVLAWHFAGGSGDPAAEAGGAAVGSGPAGSGVTKRAAFVSPQDLAEVAAQGSGDDDAAGSGSRLEGQVIDEQQQPVAGVQVRLVPGKHVATTQADGSFAFDKIAFGTYSASATLGEQYAPAARVRFTDTSEPVTLHLRRGMGLLVHVVSGGTAIADADVSVDDTHHVHTGSDGSAKLTGLGPRFQGILVVAHGFARKRDVVQLPDDPGSTTEKTVELTRGAPIGGTVVGPDGKPVGEANVQVTATGARDRQDARCDAAGAWHIDAVAAGSYLLTGTSKVYGPAPAVEVTFDGTTPRTDLVVHVLYDAQLVGTVVDQAGQPVSGASVSATTGLTGSYTEPTDARGHFEMLGIPAGAYRISARKAGDASPVTESQLADNERTDVRLVVEPTAIRGTVVDTKGDPIAEAQVSAAPQTVWSGAAGARARDTSDFGGKFSLEGLVPGTYEVTAQWPDQEARHTGSGAMVPTNTRDLKIVLPTPTSITGRVLLDDQPVGYYGVIVTDHPELGWSGNPKTIHAADGRFTIRNVQPGTTGVLIAAPGSARKVVKDVKVEDGKPTDLGDIALGHGQRITGHVHDASGAAVAGAQVRIGMGIDDRFGGSGLFATSYSTLTDASGAYAFDGIAAPKYSRVTATAAGHGAAAAQELPDGDGTVDLLLLAAGGIDGKIAGYRPNTFASVDATSPADGRTPHMGEVGAGGAFSFDNLPAGDYVISMFAMPGTPSAPAVHATVVAGQRATVTLKLPDNTVKVALHVTGVDCKFVMLARPGDGPPDPETMASMGRCANNTAQFDAVEPGPYRACVMAHCVPITVANVPTQTIEVAITPAPAP